MLKEKTAGIICEYNPFHNGHAYQIEEIRRRGYGTVVAVMSGNTVQRGEFAITDKYTRAKAALAGGADLVLELPYPYSSSSTEFFATAGIRIIDAIGADAVCFGSESGNSETLTAAAKTYMSADLRAVYKKLSKTARGSASAFFESYKELVGEEMVLESNDILAVAYISAILTEGSKLKVEVIKREGSAYRDGELTVGKDNGYPSALMIRNRILNNGLADDLCGLMPEGSFYALKNGKISNLHEHLERAVLSFFRLADPGDLTERGIAGAGGGLAKKLCKVSHQVQSLEYFVRSAMERKYTRSRVSRTILHCMTGVSDCDVRRAPAYTTVLGFNEKGKELLGTIKKTSRIPIVTKPADAARISSDAARQSMLSYKADALYSLCFDEIGKSGDWLIASPIIF